MLAALLAVAMTLLLDAREVPRRIVHARLDVPIAGGPATMVFPKWVPGEHGPLNPVVDLTMLDGTVEGNRHVAWRRDPLDLFAFTFDAPADARTLTLRYDTILEPGTTTANLALVTWEPSVLAPRGATVAGTTVAATLLLPSGWTSATHLDGAHTDGDRVTFAPVTLERLIDSPVLAGANLATFALGPDAELDVASDAPVPPVVGADVKAAFAATVAEAEALTGSHHWRAPYRFLVTATDAIGYTGLEHHESSWNGVDGDTLASIASAKKYAGDLLTHEFFHSWNGKYRRPAGLVRPDYQADEETDLLWVYEGLTEYYSDVLAARAGFWTADDYRAALAAKVAYLDAEPGRATRPLADTTFQSRLRSPAFGADLRAGSEYYDESELMWLDADTLIRERSGGRRSLDDLARAFFGGGEGGPEVRPYTRADLVAAMNAVQPFDWDGFFTRAIDTPQPHPPHDGIARGGYALRYAAKPEHPNPSTRLGAVAGDWRFGPGMRLQPSGIVTDVISGSPADAAGLTPGAKIVAVAGRRFSPAAFTAAVERAATDHAPIALLVDDRATFLTETLRYDGGVRLPQLVRASGPDRIAEIVAPRRRMVKKP